MAGEPDMTPAALVMAAYFASPADHKTAVANARAATISLDQDAVLSSLISLAAALLALRQGEQGTSWEETMDQLEAMIRMMRPG